MSTVAAPASSPAASTGPAASIPSKAHPAAITCRMDSAASCALLGVRWPGTALPKRGSVHLTARPIEGEAEGVRADRLLQPLHLIAVLLGHLVNTGVGCRLVALRDLDLVGLGLAVLNLARHLDG